MVDRATLWSFVGVLRRHWFAAMSGGFSVPFTAAAVYFDSKYAQSIFGFLALASLYFAAYQIWKSEHDKVLALQESLSPTRIREIEAQESHAAELRRHTDALEREERANTPIQLALKAAFEHKGQAQVRQIVGEPLEPFPNWAISDLFSYIDPNLLTRDDSHVDQLWDKIGNQIRDYASVGRLKIWGRPLNDGIDAVLGQRPSIRLIDPSYWRIAFFTYAFFDDTAGDASHTYLQHGQYGTEYTDLQVNRAEAMPLWHSDANGSVSLPPPSPFEISVGVDPHYYEITNFKRLHSLPKLFKLKIENADRSKTISGCKVSITSIGPPEGSRMPWILKEGFAIRAGDSEFVPLVSYEERLEPELYPENPTTSDTFEIQALSKHRPLLGIESTHILNVRCTGIDTKFIDQKLKLSVKAGRFQIEKI
jgi:hypothetical protein